MAPGGFICRIAHWVARVFTTSSAVSRKACLFPVTCKHPAVLCLVVVAGGCLLCAGSRVPSLCGCLFAGTGVEALLSPVEAAMVDELNAELRDTLSDYRWVGSRSSCAGGGGEGCAPGLLWLCMQGWPHLQWPLRVRHICVCTCDWCQMRFLHAPMPLVFD